MTENDPSYSVLYVFLNKYFQCKPYIIQLSSFKSNEYMHLITSK